MKIGFVLLGTALVVPFICLGLKHESSAARVDLRSQNVAVRVSIVKVSAWDRWTGATSSDTSDGADNRSAIGVDGEAPDTRIGTITVSTLGKVYTLPANMVRDCFTPRQTNNGWTIRRGNDGVYVGTMTGIGLGRTLVWWEISADRKVRRWVYPMQEHRDLASLPKPTDQPVETQKLLSFDE